MIKVMNSGLFWPFLAMMTTAYVLGTWSANIMFEWSVLIEMAVLWAIVFALWGIMAYLVYKYDVWLEKTPSRKDRKKEKHIESLKKDADRGVPHAQFELALLYKDGKEVGDTGYYSILMLEAAKNGHSLAQWQIGKMYLEGLQGIKKDGIKGFLWFQKAAEGGCYDCYDTLGWMYWEGKYTSQNTKKALIWLRKASSIDKITHIAESLMNQKTHKKTGRVSDKPYQEVTA